MIRYVLSMAVAVSILAGCAPRTQDQAERRQELYDGFQSLGDIDTFTHPSLGILNLVGIPLAIAGGIVVMAGDIVLGTYSLVDQRMQRRELSRLKRQANRAPNDCKPLISSNGKYYAIPTSEECAKYYD